MRERERGEREREKEVKYEVVGKVVRQSNCRESFFERLANIFLNAACKKIHRRMKTL